MTMTMVPRAERLPPPGGRLTPGETIRLWRRQRHYTRAFVLRRKLLPGIRRAPQLLALERLSDWAQLEPGLTLMLHQQLGVGPDIPERLTPGEWCWVMRLRAGLTQTVVARALGISKQTLVHWEHDQAPEAIQRLLAWWRRPSNLPPRTTFP